MATSLAERENAPAAPFEPSASAEPSDWLRPVIVIPIGAVATLVGWFVARVFVGFLPLGFYGDEDVPAGFEQPYESFLGLSPAIAGLTALVLLAAAGVLAQVRRRAARVMCTVATVCATATPWVWILVAYALADHWYHLNQ